MARAVYPFLTLPDDLPELSPWRITASGTVYENPDFIPGWDYAEGLFVERDFRIDHRRAAQELGIPDEELALRAVVRSGTGGNLLPTSARTEFDEILPKKSTQGTVSFNLNGNELSRIVHLELVIVLERSPGGAVSPLAPQTSGAVLWRDRKRIRIEGDQSRFPVSEVDLAEMLGNLGRGTLWYLDADLSDLGAPFDSVIRLYVDGQAKEFVDRFRSGDPYTIQTVMADVMVQLTTGFIVEDRHSAFAATDENESVGSVVLSWINDAFGNKREAERLLNHDPGRFHAALNALSQIEEKGDG
jgi:hypothetical protein